MRWLVRVIMRMLVSLAGAVVMSMTMARAVGMDMLMPRVGIIAVNLNFTGSTAACRTHIASPID
jgi:hypothetical protein